MSKKPKTQRQKEDLVKLGEENNKLRWICIGKPFQVHSYTLGPGWYEMTKTEILADKYRHTFKKRGFKDYFIVSDADYKKIKYTFQDLNKHLM